MPDALQSEHTTSKPPVIEISLIELARTVFAQRKKIALATAGTTLAAIGLGLILPPKYEASTTIMSPQPNASLASMMMGAGVAGSLGSLAGGGLSLKNPNDMYAGLLRSNTVEDGVIQTQNLLAVYKDKLQSEARKDLEKNTVIDSSAKDNLIHITVTDRSPKRAAAIANEYISQYRSLSSHLALTEGGQRRRFFDEQIAQTKEALTQAEDAFRQQQQVSGVLEPTAQGQVLIQSTAQLRAQIVAKEVALRGLKIYATDNNVEVQQLREEIAALNTQLAHTINGQESDDALISQAKAPKAMLDYQRKLRDVKYFQTVLEFLSKEAEVARLDEARESTTVQVVDVAAPPDKKASPRRLLIALLGLMLGFIGAVAYWALSAVRKQYQKAVRTSTSSTSKQPA